MKKLYAALIALPLVCAGTGYATAEEDHKHWNDDNGNWHRDMCMDHYAREYGKLAYLQAKLGITDKQQDAWSKWQQAILDGVVKERDTCLSDTPPGGDKPESVLAKEDHLDKMLSAKLEQIRASRAPLEALYDSLSDEQKLAFDRFEDYQGGVEGGPGMGGPGMGGHGPMKGDKH